MNDSGCKKKRPPRDLKGDERCGPQSTKNHTEALVYFDTFSNASKPKDLGAKIQTVALSHLYFKAFVFARKFKMKRFLTDN